MPKLKVLITIKSYPLPSTKYEELVCTAGVLEDGSFVRLYPIDYRYRPYWQWYRKYEWVEVEAEKHNRDPRKESYRPNVASLRTVGPFLKTWDARKQFVLAQGTKTMEELWSLRKADNTSLGIIRPAAITDFIVEPDEPEWKPKWLAQLQQLRLFGPTPKPLDKIPYKFSYRFRCDSPDCKGHQMKIEDWEVGALYRNQLATLGTPEKACESVRLKFFDQICAPTKDTHFFVGTTLQYGSWIILGVFYPPKSSRTIPTPGPSRSLL